MKYYGCYVPNLRFCLFSEPWSCFRLSEVVKNEKRAFAGGPFGSNLKSSDYREKGIPIIQLGNITDSYLDFSSNLKFASEKKADELISNNAFPNELIVAKMMPAGKACISTFLYDRYLLGSDAIRICVDQARFNIHFLCSQLNAKRVHKWITNRTGGSTRARIGIPILKEAPIYAPTVKEQNKIGTFIDLLQQRIDTQNKIIEEIKNQIKYIEEAYFSGLSCEWTKLSDLVKSGAIKLFRGNIIPKHERDSNYKYPVYSSSVNNMGLMGFYNSYMFDEELITWSIDGGGNFFYREKHKFNVTNVCGYIRTTKYDYRFLTECLIWQHRKQKFDYQSKAHPSVIASIYKVPNIDINKQKQFSYLIEKIYKKLDTEEMVLNLYNEQKKYLLDNLFI